MKNDVFWDVTLCGSYKNQCFGGTYGLHFQLLVAANIIPSSLILVALMMEVICSSKMPVLTRAIWRDIPEDGIPFCVL
jgi:hypothetical protein